MSETRFTRRDVAVLAVALVLLGCLLFPALAQSNSHSEQAICVNKLKHLALAMMNHHDTRKAFPLSSSEPINHKPGSDDQSLPVTVNDKTTTLALPNAPLYAVVQVFLK